MYVRLAKTQSQGTHHHLTVVNLLGLFLAGSTNLNELSIEERKLKQLLETVHSGFFFVVVFFVFLVKTP